MKQQQISLRFYSNWQLENGSVAKRAWEIFNDIKTVVEKSNLPKAITSQVVKNVITNFMVNL